MKHWIQAARPRTLPLSLSSISMGSFLGKIYGHFNWTIFGFTVLTTILLQILSNFANDYGDTQNGADLVGRLGPARAVQTGQISAKSMKNAIFLFSILCLISGFILLYLAFDGLNNTKFYTFLIIGLISIIAAITYTAGKNPYGYAGLGDISVLIFFGIVGVLGTFYLQTNNLNFTVFLPAISCGLFATTVLNINNLRDIDSDFKAKKRTIPVRFGKQFGVIYHRSLILCGIFLAIAYILMHFSSLKQFLFILLLPLFYYIAIGIDIEKTPAEIDTFLKKMALSSLAFSLLFGIGQLI